jgi:hypothetical protein
MDRKNYASHSAYMITVHVYKGKVLLGCLRFSHFCSSFIDKRQKARWISSHPLIVSQSVSQSVCLSVYLFRRWTQPLSISVSQPASPPFSLYISHTQQPNLFFNQSACLLVKHSHICQRFSQSAFLLVQQSYLQSYSQAVIYSVF